MTTVAPFRASDLFRFNSVNMDRWTETYSCAFYLSYLAQWPDMSYTASSARTDHIMGYVLGKAEEKERVARKGRTPDLSLHGHVTAVTVAPEYRRLGVAKMLMDIFEQVSEVVYQAYFIDLFVRPSNKTAITMYENFDYSVYRCVHRYYRGSGSDAAEDGYGAMRVAGVLTPDMRKALPRDTRRQTVRENGRKHVVQPEATLFEPRIHESV